MSAHESIRSLTYLGASVKPQAAAQKLTKTGFEFPKLVLPKIEKATGTRCTVMWMRAVSLDRLSENRRH